MTGGAIATFDFAAWQARYPEFAAVPQVTAEAYFAEAGLYWRNDGTGPVSTVASQQVLMNMLTAHIAALYIQAQGDPAPGAPKDPNTPVGAVTNASQGSISVAVQADYPPGTAQWFKQTKYGLSFWTATTSSRRFRYRRFRGGDPASAGLYGVGRPFSR